MANDKESSGYKYGSIDNDEESGAKGDDKTYDESNLYYMKEGTVTKMDKVFAIKLAVPIIIAALFIGGLAFMLFHNFGYFYPGREGRTKTSGVSKPTPTTEFDEDAPNTLFPTPPTFGYHDKNAPGVVGTSCAAYPKCVGLGLTGECCPTEDGTELECC